MEDQALNRREFLRLSLVLAGAAMMAACQSAKPQVIPIATKGIMPSPDLETNLKLRGDQADVWAHTRLVQGSMSNPAACKVVSIDNNGTRFKATLQEHFFSAEVPIHPGQNSLTAVCQWADGREEATQAITMNGRLQPRPTAMIKVSLARGLVILDGKESQPDGLENQPIRRYLWTVRPGNPGVAKVQAEASQEQQDFTAEITGARIEVELPPVDGEYYFSLQVTDEAGREDIGTTYVVVENAQPRIPDYDHENPAWVEQAIVYGVIPRLFGAPGAVAIQDRLPDLANLGVNAIWLAPINQTNDYGYSVIDYFELREGFGSKEDFRSMIQAAHARGIRVLMDFVPNHTSNQHPYFKDTLEKGQDSPYWEFYDRDENGNYTYYFDWTHLPNLNYDNPEVRRMMIEAFSYWVREFDVDGFRVDACWGVQQRRPDFWPEWRRALKRIKPDLLLLAEASARDPYNFDNGFDAAYDWTENLGQWAWGRFWSDQAEKVDTAQELELLKEALTNGPERYHPDALIFRFLNNNDTRTRFITAHGEDLTRVATALLLTLPGIPCIYTGDEVGESFLPYSDGAPLRWEERYPGLREYHRRLIALRKELPSLHSRHWRLLEVEPAEQVLGYLRFLGEDRDPALVLLNFSREKADVELALPADFGALVERGSLADRLSEDVIPLTGRNPLRLRLDPMSARILTASRTSH